MKREPEKVILVSSPQATELLKKLIKNGGEALPKVNVPNLADYSTRFYNIRLIIGTPPARICCKIVVGGREDEEHYRKYQYNKKFYGKCREKHLQRISV